MKRFLRTLLEHILRSDMPDMSVKGSSEYSLSLHSTPTFHMTVFSAIGGHVVEFRRYNASTGQQENYVYIIDSSSNLEQRLAKIIALECIR